MSAIYLIGPFIIVQFAQGVLDNRLNILQRIFFLGAFITACITNYTDYLMASSICLYNTIIAKHLYPIQFSKTPKRLSIGLKIDSFISRLNKEFVGFRCLYSIKFTRKSFYQYILGLSSAYFMFKNSA